MNTTIVDELTRIADECDARGLFEIANEIDAALADSSMNRFADKGHLVELSNRLFRIAQEDQYEMSPEAFARMQRAEIEAEPDRHQHGNDFPNIDDPTDPDFVGQEELEAASDILEKLLGQLPQEDEAPEEPMDLPPRISANMGDLSRIRTASKRQNLSEAQREQIMRRMN